MNGDGSKPSKTTEKTWLFKPGCKPGPGRPSNSQALANLIGARSNNGRDLIDRAFDFLDGKILNEKVLPDGSVILSRPSVEARMEALKMLLDRFAGKPKETVDHGVTEETAELLTGQQVKVLSDGDLVTMAAILTRAIEASSRLDPGRDLNAPPTTVIELQPSRPNGAPTALPPHPEEPPGTE